MIAQVRLSPAWGKNSNETFGFIFLTRETKPHKRQWFKREKRLSKFFIYEMGDNTRIECNLVQIFEIFLLCFSPKVLACSPEKNASVKVVKAKKGIDYVEFTLRVTSRLLRRLSPVSVARSFIRLLLF